MHLVEEYEAKYATAAGPANQEANRGRGRPSKVIVKRRTRVVKVVKVKGLLRVLKMREI